MSHFSISNPIQSRHNSTPVTSVNGGKELKKKKNTKTKGASAVKLSTDPQSVAARLRRHRISDRFKILQSLVPGGSKMDTVSMLEEAIQYVKFLKNQIWLHQAMINFMDHNVDRYHDPTLINLPPNNISSALPFDHHQQFDLFNNYYSGDDDHQVQAAVTQVGFPDSWFVPVNPFM